MARTATFLTVLYTVLVGLSSLIPVPKINDAPENSDKLLHFLAYFIFTVLWFLFFYLFKRKNTSLSSGIRFSVFFAFIYGTIIEVLQGTLTSYRSADLSDILANTIGICLAAIFILVIRSPLKRLKQKF